MNVMSSELKSGSNISYDKIGLYFFRQFSKEQCLIKVWESVANKYCLASCSALQERNTHASTHGKGAFQTMKHNNGFIKLLITCFLVMIFFGWVSRCSSDVGH